MRVVRRDRLGGLIQEYAQVAYGDSIFGIHTARGRRWLMFGWLTTDPGRRRPSRE
jgi:hypothetical protein